MEGRIRVLIVEDDRDFAYLIQKTVGEQPDMETVGVCAAREQAVSMAQALNPDIVLMDLNLSDALLDGVDAAKEIRVSTRSKVIILTAFENPRVVIEASKKAFASGYIYKSQFDLLVNTVRATAQGHTPQEHMIFSLIVSDLTIAERTVLESIVGQSLQLLSSQKTIANQKTMILKKLGLKTQKDLTSIFLPFRDYL